MENDHKSPVAVIPHGKTKPWTYVIQDLNDGQDFWGRFASANRLLGLSMWEIPVLSLCISVE